MRAGQRAASGSRSEHLVVVTDAPLVSGAEQALGRLISELDIEIPITVASVDVGVGRWIAAHRADTPVVELPPLTNKRDLMNLRRTRNLLSELSPTVLHLNKTEVGGLRYVEILGHTIPNVRVVSVVHHVETPGSVISGVLSRVLARRADAIVAVGQSLARELESILKLPLGRVTSIHNTVGSGPAITSTSPTGVDRPFTVGMLSRLVGHKRVEDVVAAVSQLGQTRLIVGGSGSELTKLKARVDALGSSEDVVFLGWVAPEEVFQQIDVYVLASEIEGHPISLLQAQQAGLPIVASNVGGVPEIVSDQVDGFLFDPGDIDGLVDALRSLRDDPELRKRMAIAAESVAGQRPSGADMAAEYTEIFWPMLKAG